MAFSHEGYTAVWVDENEFPLRTKWVRNNQFLGYESSEFAYEWPGYETTVGTKQLVSGGHPHRTPLDRPSR